MIMHGHSESNEFKEVHIDFVVSLFAANILIFNMLLFKKFYICLLHCVSGHLFKSA